MTLDWDFIKSCLKARREIRDMKKAGYRMHETDWEIDRGSKQDQIIVDVKIGYSGKFVWTKLGPKQIDKDGNGS